MVTEYPVPTANSQPYLIAPGPDGALWFTEPAGNKIGRITTSGVIAEYPVPTVGSEPDFIAAGPDGALWFTELAGNKIGRITTSGSITEYPVPTANADRKLSRRAGTGPLVHGDQQQQDRANNDLGADSEYPLPTAGSGPTGIVVGTDGALWFVEQMQTTLDVYRSNPWLPLTILAAMARATSFGATAAATWYLAGERDDDLALGGVGGVPAIWSIVGSSTSMAMALPTCCGATLAATPDVVHGRD